MWKMHELRVIRIEFLNDKNITVHEFNVISTFHNVKLKQTYHRTNQNLKLKPLNRI